MKQLYVVRHCKAEGQPAEARLTPEGIAQAERLAMFMLGQPIERIVSSPFLRARQSALPLASRLGLQVELDDRLAERVLAAGDLPDWLDRLNESFADPDLAFEGGESGRAAQERAVAVAIEALEHSAATSVIVSHGNLITLLLNHFDRRFGFAQWQALSNPDVYRVTVDHSGARVERVWY